MKKRAVLALMALLVCAILTGCIPALPKGFDKETLIEKAKQVVLLMDERDYDAIWALGRDDFKELVPVSFLKDALEHELNALGRLVLIGDTGAYGATHGDTQESLAVAQLKCTFAMSTLNVRITLDVDLKLAAITLEQ